MIADSHASKTEWRIRTAGAGDIPRLEALIPVSARKLQAGFYPAELTEAALGSSFGVDRQLIADGTYFVAEAVGGIVGCGGWSFRLSLSGVNQGRILGLDEERLNPETDAARIRAFFVHPDFSRRGIGRAILQACEEAIAKAGFKRIEIVATLPGKMLYSTAGYGVTGEFMLIMPNGMKMPVVRMTKSLPERTSANLGDS